MDKMKRAKSDTGKVHYIEVGPSKKSNLVVPFCDGLINGVFINWKPWSLTNESVTCKNCLSKAGEKLYLANGVFRRLGSLDRVIQRKFMTKRELDAYLQGLKDGKRCNRIKVNGSTV